MITEATRECFAALTEMIQRQGRGGRWLVLTHDNPDPDALASAQILARVLRQAFRQKVTAAYGGIIGRAENREMVRSLRLSFSHIRHLSFKNYRHFALVDTQPRSGNNQLPPRIVPDIVIDHHPVRANTQTGPFYDIRPKYGATATILAEYMLAAGVQPTHALATALIYALRSETQDFAREYAGPDKAIHDLFFPRANHRLLARIQSPRLPFTYFSNLHDALENMESVDSLILSHLGPIEQPDIVPEIADLLLQMEGKTWALATGYYQDRLYLSIRTTNTRADAGGLMRRVIGRRGKGGGHGMIAGGWIDASKVTGPAERREMQKRLGIRLAKELKKNPEKIGRIELRVKAEEPPAEAKEGSKKTV
ncbi:MAG TPA: DHHA1 domain-containing protein [Thermoanaerobaculia bacterium]|jgi:nanoRNase/pAp phosphatase (c-di-AMP/oligoRNAs hydrolase)|nr:DHHA1 domain-containing protein [Thermoanaerobaculia bacterium]